MQRCTDKHEFIGLPLPGVQIKEIFVKRCQNEALLQQDLANGRKHYTKTRKREEELLNSM